LGRFLNYDPFAYDVLDANHSNDARGDNENALSFGSEIAYHY